MKTSTMHHELPLEDKRTLILSLPAKFPGQGPKAKIDWTAAFDADPQLKKKLGVHDQKTRQRVYNLSSSLFKTNPIIPQEQPSSSTPAAASLAPTNGNGNAAVPAVKPERASKEERIEIVKQAKREFVGAKGNVSWTKAFEAHPEWKVKLGIATNEDMRAFYPFAKHILNPGAYSGKKKIRISTRSAKNEEVETGQVVVAGCKFCPHCGNNLELYHRVTAAMMDLRK